MNIIKEKNNRIIKLESYWRKNKNNNKLVDALGTPYPYPDISKINQWTDKENFLDRLLKIEKIVILKNKCKNLFKFEKCLICKTQEKITCGEYILDNIIWKDNLKHYIIKHNIKPSNEFIDFIYQYDISKKTITFTKISGETYQIDSIKYLKINKNQLAIADALLIHGGYTQKYSEGENFKYSEHFGLFDLDNIGLDKVIISAKTSRVDKGDESIYLPQNIKESYEYEYIFHTHPPTPKPGGRVKDGILYDFPSVNDIFHFIKHHNKGNLQGSLVFASEGLYNIRNNSPDLKEKINVKSESTMFDNISNTHADIQEDAIEKYGTEFTNNYFYSKIAHDNSFIDRYNKLLNKYNIHIDYFPRIKDKKNNWYIDSIYLPIMVTEKI
jgi:hypothetical protein